MTISPPIAVLTILVLGLATTVWLVPQPREATDVTVTLPAATYEKLVLLEKARGGANERSLTIVQFIEELAANWEKHDAGSASEPGASRQ